MRRAILAIGGTVTGLAVLFSFKAHSLAAATPVSSAPTAASSAPAQSPAPAATRTITSAVAMTRDGPMQVKVTIVGQRITRIIVMQGTGHGGNSQRIASFTIPKRTS